MITSFLYLVTLSYITSTESGFYIGQPLTVRCKLSGLPDDPFIMLQLLIGDTFNIECLRNPGGWCASLSYPPLAGVNITALTKEDCELLEKDNTMSVKFIITEGLKNLNITCFEQPLELKAARFSEFLFIRETKREYTLIYIQS